MLSEKDLELVKSAGFAIAKIELTGGGGYTEIRPCVGYNCSVEIERLIKLVRTENEDQRSIFNGETTELFRKEYDGESIVDVDRDVTEAFDPRFNDLVKQIPQDQHGFQEGTFIVTVEWKSDEA